MDMILTLSRNTSNSIDSLLPLPFHYVLGLRNTLKIQTDKENADNEAHGASMPQLPTSFSFNSPYGNNSLSI